MLYGIGLFLLGGSALALSLFRRDLVELLRSPLRSIAESMGVPSTKPETPIVPDATPAAAADPEALAQLPSQYGLTLQMRLFFAVLGLPLLVLGFIRMSLDVFPSDDDDDDASVPSTTANTQPSTTDAPSTTPSTEPDALPGCPPVRDGFFRLGRYYQRPNTPGTAFQVVDPSLGADPNSFWIDQAGLPVLNPNFPLTADTIAVAQAFGSPQAAVDYNRCALRPIR